MLKAGNFIERSLLGALSFLKESIFAEEYASRGGLLQSLDARMKLATFLGFIIQILLARDIPVILFFYVLCILLACLSKINLVFFLKRTWIFIPLFSLFIAVPALFSVFTPGEALFSLRVGALHLIITRQGFSTASLFVIRVLTCVSFAVLLSLTTRHFELLRVLRIFLVPQVFVMTIGICYRYIYLFIGMIENTYQAIKSRVGTLLHYKEGQRIVAWNMASLWQRSLHLSEDVYQAMLSRGYRGEPVVLSDFRFRLMDWLWLFGAGLISLAAFYHIHGMKL